MCTLALAWQVFEDAPVAVAANRDEATDRPSTPPTRSGGDPTVVAPRDVVAGGTWIGVNDRGLFAGITNRWGDDLLEGGRSRGLLVDDVLSRSSAASALSLVERLTDEDTYAGFYLVVADAADAFVLEWDGALESTRIDPGVHVVVNVGVDDAFRTPSRRPDAARRQAQSARRLRTTLEVEPGESATAWLERAGDVLGDHEYGVCVHGDGFGTRSSSLVAVGDRLAYAFADGPPCRTDYEDVGIDLRIGSHAGADGREGHS